MGKYRGRFRNQNNNQRITNIDNEMDIIREQQKQQHQASVNSERSRRSPPHIQVVALLENGSSFNGKAVMFNNPNMPRCRIFFKDKNRHELGIDTDISIKPPSPDKISALQSTINSYLEALHQEANMDFPAWLEKYSTRVNESNPFFNLDEIRAEFKYKKSRFGAWRVAAQIGFFDDLRPQYANFNRIVHIEIGEN